MPTHNAVPEPEQLDRELQVLELRRAGFTWQRIAEQVGYADHSGAYVAYKRAIKRVLKQPAEELRQQELDRIDRLQLAVWNKALAGDVRALLAVVKLMERRAKLLGLDSPIKIQQDVTTWEGGDSIDRAVRELAALLQSNDPNSQSAIGMGADTGKTISDTTAGSVEHLDDSDGPRMGQD